MKCIAKKCEDCRLYTDFDMTNKEGLRKTVKKCILFVLADEIPRIRGSVDGLQGGVNEARNRSMETKARVEDFGNASVQVLNNINTKLIE